VENELRAGGRSPAAVRELKAAWKAHRADGVPRRLVAPTSRALKVLTRAAKAHNRGRTRNAALDVTQSALDLQLRYQPQAEIDRARFDLWTRQVGVDAAARNRAAVSGDVATLEWIRDRIARTTDSVAVTRIDTQLEELRGKVADNDLPAAAKTATALRRVLASARVTH